MKCFYTFLFFFYFSFNVFATHGQNAKITYKCIAANTYEISLEIYRDCNGINLGSSASVSYSATCTNGNISNSITLFRISEEDVTPLCNTQPSSCDNGSGSLGIEKHTYRGTLTLPYECSSVQLDYSLCCRANSITSLSNPGAEELYTRTTFNASSSICNNSPNFNNDSVVYGSRNQINSISLNAIDIDGDTLTYELSNPLGTNGLPIAYRAGFDFENPFGIGAATVFSLDQNSGMLCFNVDSPDVTPIGITVREYRNGAEIATYQIEYYIQVLNTASQIPYFGANPNQCTDLDITLTQTSSSLVETSENSLTITANDSFCFSLDVNDIVDFTGVTPVSSTTSNAESVLPGATYTITGNNTDDVTAELCWTPTNADEGTHTVLFSVFDESSCPIRSRRDYIYNITVNENTLGVNNIIENKISVWPNPVKNTLHISNYDTSIKYSIYNISGKKIISGENKDTISTSALNPGIYFIKLESVDKVFTRKLIKI